MRNLILILLMSVFTNVFAQQKSVSHAVETLTKLMVNPDKTGLDLLVHKGLSYGHSSGKIETKIEFMDQLLSKRSDFVKIDILEQQIVEVGKTATVRHILDAETFDGGVKGHVKLKILLVWVKENKEWKLLARQAVKF